MGLITEYPSWFVLFCLILGFLYAFFLYFRINREYVRQWQILVMSAARFLAVFFISVLLLSPLINQTITIVEKPAIILGQDNSQSLTQGKDSSFYREVYPQAIDRFIKELRPAFDVYVYSFGDKVRTPLVLDYQDKLTDISAFLEEMENRYFNRNVGAVIIASDGIYNYGANPFYTANDLPFLCFTVNLGDTTENRELIIRKCVFNKQVFLGDQFPVEIHLGAKKCNGELVRVQIRKGDQVLHSREIKINADPWSMQTEMVLDAKQSGWQRFSVEVIPLNPELKDFTQKRELFLEVQEIRSRIALVSDAPHPDMAAILQAITPQRRYTVTEFTSPDFQSCTDSFDLVILYQVPSLFGNRLNQEMLERFPAKLFILGSQSDITAFNKLKSGIILSAERLSFSEAYPELNQRFTLFTVDESLERSDDDFPPLQSPFAVYQSDPSTEVLYFQKIGNTRSSLPLICFVRKMDQRTGFIFGENCWRWRIYNFVQEANHESFDALIQKIVRYLSVKTDQRPFRVSASSQYPENKPVEFEAVLYNPSFELINTPEVSLAVSDEPGNTYPFVFGKTGKGYFLDAGTFPAGIYHYIASVTIGTEKHEATGTFIVEPVNLEALDLQANHHILNRIATSHRGASYSPVQLEQLAKDIKDHPEIHAVSYTHEHFGDLIGNIWLFIWIIGLLTLEWLMRKNSGL